MSVNSPRLCQVCEKPAAFSLCVVVSSLGIAPRAQASGEVLRFCRNCFVDCCAAVSASPALKEVQQNLWETRMNVIAEIEMRNPS